ncbi:MAG TPA: LuxR family transcriptional regulator [Desulfonatronum sp.]|nr:LuxR family transcriptional regulator [Desulfonatronum sp.]
MTGNTGSSRRSAPVTQPAPGRTRFSGELSTVVRAFSDHVLFADPLGTVLASNASGPDEFPKNPVGQPFWNVLNLKTEDLNQTLARYPVNRVHRVSSPSGKGAWILRIIPLPTFFSPNGFVVLATNIKSLQKLRDSYKERIGENIQALENSIQLFGAMFDGVQDAMLLLCEDHLVYAANPMASELLDPEKLGLYGREAKTLFSSQDWKKVEKRFSTLKDGARWTSRRTCLTTGKIERPVEATLWRIDLEGFALFHLALRDLTARTLLEKGLRRKKAEVEGMNLALRNVVRSTEKEKREVRREVLREIREDFLPALDRMASEASPELRNTLKTMIQERLQEMTAGSSKGMSPLLIRLTPREIEICKLIRLGSATKDIAELLNASFDTIQTHRKNIRRKLGLKGRRISLFSFLHQQELLE